MERTQWFDTSAGERGPFYVYGMYYFLNSLYFYVALALAHVVTIRIYDFLKLRWHPGDHLFEG